MAMKVIGVGTATSSADANEYFVNTKFVTKPANETRTSTTFPTNDADLILHVDANKIYIMDIYMVIFSSNAGGNFRWGFQAPAGTILYGHSVIHDPSGSGALFMNVYDNTATGLFTTGSNAANSNNAAGINDFVRISGILNTAGTAGNVIVKWAQQNSNGNDTNMRAGSSMLIRRVS